MCGLAELLKSMGAQVSGSDLAENQNTDRLQKLGVKFFKGHNQANVGDADVVVYSTAVKADNPEIEVARAKKIPLIPRAEALAEIMRLKRGIAVSGTHGKTTTTSMVASILLHANTNPTIFVGGRLDRIDSTALLGEGEWLVAEADESDGSFHKLSPEIAVITNIDSDHLDHFKTFENLQRAFYDFALKLPFYGACVVCGDDPEVVKLFKDFPKKIIFYGFNDDNDWQVKGNNGHYEVYQNGKLQGKMKIHVPGRHNALNALAAVISSVESGLSVSECLKGIETFQGVDRRFQLKGEVAGIKVYDDYGHHPTEVRAVLQAFKEKFPNSSLVVAFQPHRYSRTQHCWHEFTTCFTQADKLLLLDVYPAGEKPIAGIDSAKLIKEIKHSNSNYIPKTEVTPEKILSILNPGDVFLTLGAGDGWKLGMDVLAKLKKI